MDRGISLTSIHGSGVQYLFSSFSSQSYASASWCALVMLINRQNIAISNQFWKRHNCIINHSHKQTRANSYKLAMCMFILVAFAYETNHMAWWHIYWTHHVRIGSHCMEKTLTVFRHNYTCTLAYKYFSAFKFSIV